MSGVQGSGVDLYARARLRFPITVTGTDTLVNGAGLPSGFISLTDLTSFIFESNGANTGAVTLDIGDGVARQVVASDHRALHAGDIQSADCIIECVYDASVDKFHAMIDEGVGKGQTWQDVSASRAAGVTYTNTTGKTISVNITSAYNTAAQLTINGTITSPIGLNVAGQAAGKIFPIPAGNTYLCTASFYDWKELR